MGTYRGLSVPSGRRLGPVGVCWGLLGHVEACWGLVEACWGPVGGLLGPRWSLVEVCCGLAEASQGLVETYWVLVGAKEAILQQLISCEFNLKFYSQILRFFLTAFILRHAHSGCKSSSSVIHQWEML
jgi:hypothetical protein